MAPLIQEKIRQAVGILRELDIDCWLTFTRESELLGDPVLPFLVDGAVTWHSAFIVTSSGKTLAIVGQYDKPTVEETGAYDEVTGYVEGIAESFVATMRALDPRTIAINYSEASEICDGLTHGMYLTLVGLLSRIGYQDRLVSAERLVSALRERKTATELGRIRQATEAAEAVFRSVRGFIGPGRTESEIADFMRREVEIAGLDLAWQPRTCPSVFSGPDTAEAHHAPTGREVRGGHVLNIDFGVRASGYCSDLQRTFYVREHANEAVPEEVQRGFETIVTAIESARRALRPGVLGLEVDRCARDIVVEAGYESFPHGLGHQVGRFAHDGTALLGPPWEKYASKPFQPVEEGMVFTLEPRLTVLGRGVVTVEEMVVVTGDGAVFLSEPQLEIRVV